MWKNFLLFFTIIVIIILAPQLDIGLMYVSCASLCVSYCILYCAFDTSLYSRKIMF